MKIHLSKRVVCFCFGLILASCFALYNQNLFSAESSLHLDFRIDNEEAPESFIWEGSLLELSSWLIEAATADGNLDWATLIKDRVIAGERVSKIHCRQFLYFAVKIANNYRNYGQYKNAEELSKLATEALVQIGGENSSGMATLLTLQGTIAVDCDRFADARQLFTQAIGIYLKSENPKIEENLALWFYLGQTEIKTGSSDRAEEIFQELLTKTEKSLPSLHAMVLASLSEIYLTQKEMEKANKYISRAAELSWHSYLKGKTGISYIASRYALYSAYNEKFENANEQMDLALQHGKAKNGFLSVIVARRHQEFADILAMQDKTEEAREHLQQAIDIRTGLHGEDHKTVRDLQSQLYKLQTKSNDPVLSLEEPDISKAEAKEVIPSSFIE